MLGMMGMASAQELQYSNHYTSSFASVRDMVSDASGNIYLVGFFNGTVDFDPGAGITNLTSNGGPDIFVKKLDASNNLVWAHSFGGTSQDFGTGIALDASGNVYVTGGFQESVDFDPGVGINTLSSVGLSDLFVLKLNNSGILQWVYQGGGAANDQGQELVVDASENVYITGTTQGGDFDNTAGTTTLGDGSEPDILIVKLNSSGLFDWGIGLGEATIGGGTGYAIKLENSGDVFVGGLFQGTVDFDPAASVENHTSNGDFDAFLIQFSSSGIFQEALVWGGTEYDHLYNIEFNSTGDLITVGSFEGTVDFDPYAGVTSLTSLSGNTDRFIQSLDVVAGNLNWVVQTDREGTSIDLDANDYIYSSGLSMEILDTKGNSIFSADQNNLEARVTEVIGNDFYTAGYTLGGVNFNLCNGSNVGGGSFDAFLAKYTIESPADIPSLTATNTNVCGSETVTLSILSGNLNSATSWQWRSGSCNGPLVGTGTSVTVTPSVSTTYFVKGVGYSCLSAGDCASITINVNEPPTGINISSANINEELSIGTTVGLFSTIDATISDNHTYGFVSGVGDTDNSSFLIAANELRSNEVFDFETKNTYSIRIQSEDQLGCTFEEVFTITINNVTPESPTDITLSSNSLNENNSINLVVGSFTTIDDDAGETYTYSLVSGIGDADNVSFNINGSDLRASESFDFETKNSYSIRVQTNDGNGGTFEKEFIVTINNVLESGNNILTFSIPEQIASPVIDDVTHEVKVEVPFGTDKTALIPTFTISSGALSNPNSGVSQNFNAPVDYTITAEDGTDQIWSVTVYAPILSGTYTVGVGGDYSNFNNAISDLNNNGIAGDVVFEILNHQTANLTEKFTIVDYPGTANHSLTLRPTLGVSTINFDGRLVLKGVENFIVEGMKVFHFLNVIGISVESEEGKPSSNIIINDSYMDNVITAVGLSGVDGIAIDGNVIRGATTSGSIANHSGVSVFSTNVSNVTISNNDILFGTEFSGQLTSSVSGFRQTDQVMGYVRIYNNTVYLNPTKSNTIRGFGVWADDIEIYHNTILVNGGNTETSNVQGISATATNSLIIKNNIIEANAHTDGAADATKLGITYDVGATTTIEDNNITFISEGINREGFIRAGSIVYDEDDLTTIENLFRGTTTTNVIFADEGNGDFKLAGASVDHPDLRGNPIALVTTDFDGAVRSTLSPTKGAFEHTNTGASVLAISFAEQMGDETIDGGKRTIDAVAVANTDITDLSPELTLSAGATSNPASGSSQDFSQGGVSYTVNAETGGASQVWTINITEFNAIPTDIFLSSNSINENEITGTITGTFSTSDENTSQVHTYSLVSGIGDADNTSFNINGNQLEAAEVFDFETKSSYFIRVQTDDGNGGTFEKQFTISVDNVNENPTNIILSPSSIAENNSINDVIGTLSTIDDDNGETYTYSLIPNGSLPVPDNASFNINGNELRASVNFDFETKSSYLILVRTDDGNGGIYSRTLSITISDESEAPSDVALNSNNIQENNSINDVVGTLSTTDEDAGETYTYALVAGAGDTENGSFNINGNELRASEAFNFEAKSTYSVRIQTNDGNGGLLAEEFTISITDEPEAPTDILLSSTDIDESAPIGTVVGLLSTADEDNGEIHTYTLVSGTGDTDNSSFSIVGNELRGVEVFDFETQTSYSIRIQTNDGNGGILQEAFTIAINDQPPGLTGVGITSSNIDEAAAVGTPIGNLFALGDEIDGVGFTFTLVTGTGDTGNGAFEIVGGQLRSTTSFNFETQNQYSLRVNANDGAGATIDQVLLVDVNDLNEAPTSISLDVSNTNEGAAANTFMTDILVDDPDNGDSHTFTLVSGSGDDDNDVFNIGGVPSQLINLEDFDFERQHEYKVRIRATDAGGLFFDFPLTIGIFDLNEAPVILDQTFEVSEFAEDNFVIGAISAVDPDTEQNQTLTFDDIVPEPGLLYQIAPDGTLSVEDASFLDFEDQPGGQSVSFSVTVTDNGTGMLSSTATITVNTIDENEAPTDLSLDNTTIDESNPIGTVVGVLSVSDVDITDSHTFTLKSGVTDNEAFAISGDELVTNEVLDFETQPSYSVEVVVTDQGGLTFEQTFSISVNDLPAQITSIELNNTTINENETGGTLVGTLSTSGEDLSGSYTYTLVSGSGDTNNASFTISGDHLLTAESFNFEAQSSYSIRVMTDDGSLIETEAFTINVNDVNEAPTEMMLSGNSITENNTIGDVIGTFSSSDEDDGQTHAYSLVPGSGDTDNATFQIVDDRLQAAVVFDFETQSNYSIRVETNDGNGGIYQEIFTISIIDQNESIVLANPIADQNLDEGFGTLEIDLNDVFQDQDGDGLSFEVASSNTDVVTVSTTEATLTISEIGTLGSSTISISADDGSGFTTSDEFMVTVNDVNEAPVVTNSFPDGFGAPEGFGMTQINYGNVFSDPDGDELTITLSSSDENVVTVALIANNQFSVNEVGIGESTITVTATDPDGASVSDTFTFTVREVLGFEEEINLRVYPNPAMNVVNIESQDSITVRLSDLNGKELRSEIGHKIQMDIGDLARGVYLLTIDHDGQIIQKRIIKAN